MTYEDTSKWALIYFTNKCFLLTISFLPSVLLVCHWMFEQVKQLDLDLLWIHHKTN